MGYKDFGFGVSYLQSRPVPSQMFGKRIDFAKSYGQKTQKSARCLSVRMADDGLGFWVYGVALLQGCVDVWSDLVRAALCTSNASVV